MKYSETYQDFLSRLEMQLLQLPDKPEETPASTLHALWHLAAGHPMCVEQASRTELPELDTKSRRTLESLIEQRIAGKPLSHLTGRQQFMELEFLVGPQALVPRKETEILGRTALNLLTSLLRHQDHALVIDVCTGAGNIALCLAHACPGANVLAADLSSEAVELARRNATRLELDARVDFRSGDLLEPFPLQDFQSKVDVLTCNPPYISSGRLDSMPKEISHHEPKLAFDGGPFGLSLLGRLLKQAPQYLRPGGWLVFEVGLGQGEPLCRRLGKNPDYRTVKLHHDNEGNARVLALQT